MIEMDPAGLDFPAAQQEVAHELAPVVVLYVPAGHGEHKGEPVVGAKVPTAQAVQAVAAEAADDVFPTAQA